MAKDDVLKTLETLGGRATTREIADALNKASGRRELDRTGIYGTLRQLSRKGVVRIVERGGPMHPHVWELVASSTRHRVN